MPTAGAEGGRQAQLEDTGRRSIHSCPPNVRPDRGMMMMMMMMMTLFLPSIFMTLLLFPNFNLSDPQHEVGYRGLRNYKRPP